MLDNLFKKINQILIIKIVVGFTLVGVVVANAKIIVDNIVNSQGIDEQIVSEANPRLNKKQLQNAIDTLKSFSSQELTSNSSTATLEKESTNSGSLEKSNTSIEIQNASGVNGAASELSEKISLAGYQISAVSTAPSLQGQTTVYFKPGKAEVAQNIKNILESESWVVNTNLEGEADQQFDILIVLGK